MQQDSKAVQARPKRYGSFLIWLIPATALVLVGYLVYQGLASQGPTISITFDTAEGILPQQTEVRYKAVRMGLVQDVRLNEDNSRVEVTVSMNENAESMLTNQTRFWVVRPRLQAGLRAMTAGLKTLVSGAYIAMDPGSTQSAGTQKERFVGLEEPPGVRSDQPGTVYFLRTFELGRLGTGSPVRYHDMDVGEVLGHEMEEDGDGVRIRFFVHAPFDEKVVSETRFWKPAPLLIENDAEGLSLELESAHMLLSGGIAFDTPEDALANEPSLPNSVFELHESEALAKVDFFSSIPYVSYFQSSVRGLSVGSEVHMFGRRVGAVTDISLTPHNEPGPFAVRVSYVLQPERVFPPQEQDLFERPNVVELAENNLRVVLETTSFLTGEKALALDYFPGSNSATPRQEGDALVLPSETRDIMDVSTKLARIASDVDRIPFAEIGGHLNRTLAVLERRVSSPEIKRSIESLDATLVEAKKLVREARLGIEPALKRLPDIARKLESTVDQTERMVSEGGFGPDSTIQRNVERMTARIASAAESVRQLSDYLERHPEALLRGRKDQER